MKSFITIFSANNLVEAEIVKDALVAQGIEVRVLNKHTATIYPHVDAIGVQVQVPKDQAKDARRVVISFGSKNY